MKWNRVVLSLTAVFMMTSLIGCNSSQDHSKHQSYDTYSQTQIAGDLRETTANKNELPSFLKDMDPRITQVYKLSAEHAELLKWIPCYCGCGESAGHQSNLNCFIYEMKKDGSIVWDSHGTKCGTCLEIAAESAALKEQGKSNLEIRNYIDNKYKKGYAKPTPTPMPS